MIILPKHLETLGLNSKKPRKRKEVKSLKIIQNLLSWPPLRKNINKINNAKDVEVPTK